MSNYSVSILKKFEFSLKLSEDIEKLFQLITSYENYSEYLPNQIKNVKIIEKNGPIVITEETLVLSTLIKKEFKIKELKQFGFNIS